MMFGVSNVCERAGIEQHQVSTLPCSTLPQHFVQTKKNHGRIEVADLIFNGSQVRHDMSCQFFMQAETGKQRLAVSGYRKSGTPARCIAPTISNLFLTGTFGIDVTLSISIREDECPSALPSSDAVVLEPCVISEAMIDAVTLLRRTPSASDIAQVSVLNEACE